MTRGDDGPAQTQHPVSEVVPAEWLEVRIRTRTARGIADEIALLIERHPTLKGRYLPTVRNLAATLRVSPTTVAHAWHFLVDARLIRTGGSQGTFIRDDDTRPAHRFRAVSDYQRSLLDLSTPVPDPELLPTLLPRLATLAHGTVIPEVNQYGGEPILPALLDHARETWPFEADLFTASNGGYDGVLLLMESLVRPGTRVAVENPTAAPFLDLIEYLGGQAVPVATDDAGMLPEALETALAMRPAVVLIQPRFSAPAGHTLTEERAAELAMVLLSAETTPMIIEDDPAPGLARGDAVSLGNWLPDNVVLVRSWNKSHGPDLRVAVMGGAEQLVRAAQTRRSMGAVWTSRILQALLVGMLRDPTVEADIGHASAVYRSRHAALAGALRDQGIATTGWQGWSLWVPVRDEDAAVAALLDNGIKAAPGRNFLAARSGAPFLRVAITQLPVEESPRVASILARA